MGTGLTMRQAALLVFAVSLATIAGAWAFEVIGEYVPCALCLKQRWAYYAVVPLAGLLIVMPPLQRVGLIVCGLIMIAGAGLGVYHAGAEWGFWPGPQSCGSGAGLSGGLPDLSTAKVIRCDEAQWRMFGLSFAGWNVVVSLFVAAAAFCGVAGKRYGSSSVSQ